MLLNLFGNVLTDMARRERKKPLLYQVALLSRQSSQVSRDFSLLYDELSARLGTPAVTLRACDSERDGKLAFALNMKEQLKIASRSRVVVLDGYNPVVCVPPASERTKVVQLWHAPGAVKKFGYQSLDTEAGRSSSYAAEAHMHENYDYIIAAGKGAIDAYAAAFGYSSERIVPLGMPQLDYLLDSDEGSARKAKEREAAEHFSFLENGKPNFVYAPTLRNGASNAGWETKYLTELARAFKEQGADANLVFTGHPLDHDFDASLQEAYPFVKTCPGVSTIDLLDFADCVITDYSSIALEAGLLGSNVCFYVPDLALYEKSPGLNVDLRDSSVCLASEDAAEVVSAAMAGTAPCFDAWRSYVHRYFEGLTPGATQRISDFIERLLDRTPC